MRSSARRPDDRCTARKTGTSVPAWPSDPVSISVQRLSAASILRNLDSSKTTSNAPRHPDAFSQPVAGLKPPTLAASCAGRVYSHPCSYPTWPNLPRPFISYCSPIRRPCHANPSTRRFQTLPPTPRRLTHKRRGAIHRAHHSKHGGPDPAPHLLDHRRRRQLGRAPATSPTRGGRPSRGSASCTARRERAAGSAPA